MGLEKFMKHQSEEWGCRSMFLRTWNEVDEVWKLNLFVFVCLCMCKHMGMCVCVYMYTWVYVCVHQCVCKCTCVCAYLYVCNMCASAWGSQKRLSDLPELKLRICEFPDVGAGNWSLVLCESNVCLSNEHFCSPHNWTLFQGPSIIYLCLKQMISAKLSFQIPFNIGLSMLFLLFSEIRRLFTFLFSKVIYFHLPEFSW